MSEKYDYDLIVLGAGPGGYVAAIRASLWAPPMTWTRTSGLRATKAAARAGSAPRRDRRVPGSSGARSSRASPAACRRASGPRR
jgi:thioredoxin reductase